MDTAGLQASHCGVWLQSTYAIFKAVRRTNECEEEEEEEEEVVEVEVEVEVVMVFTRESRGGSAQHATRATLEEEEEEVVFIGATKNT